MSDLETTIAQTVEAAVARALKMLPIGNATPSWRERIWLAPPETRLGVDELAEALGRSRKFIYRRLNIPRQRLDGVLMFKAGDIRTWIKRTEEDK